MREKIQDESKKNSFLARPDCTYTWSTNTEPLNLFEHF